MDAFAGCRRRRWCVLRSARRFPVPQWRPGADEAFREDHSGGGSSQRAFNYGVLSALRHRGGGWRGWVGRCIGTVSFLAHGVSGGLLAIGLVQLYRTNRTCPRRGPVSIGVFLVSAIVVLSVLV